MVSIIAMVPNENWTRIEISEALSLPSNHSMDIVTLISVYLEASLRNWLVYKLTSSPVRSQTNQ